MVKHVQNLSQLNWCTKPIYLLLVMRSVNGDRPNLFISIKRTWLPRSCFFNALLMLCCIISPIHTQGVHKFSDLFWYVTLSRLATLACVSSARKQLFSTFNSWLSLQQQQQQCCPFMQGFCYLRTKNVISDFLVDVIFSTTICENVK